jgi:hypothetical protein
VDRPRFDALSPWGQAVTVFHHCLLGDQGKLVARWMQTLDPALLAWMARECGNGAQP